MRIPLRIPHNFVDLTGKKFNKLLILKRAENKHGKAMWICKGKEFQI
jgi:hypothetical protein